jgi:hypothetical protein
MIAVAVIAASLTFCISDFHGVHWVGQTDLRVTFFVTDADTGLPIRGATIQCRLEDREPDEEEFALTTDLGGKAARIWTS